MASGPPTLQPREDHPESIREALQRSQHSWMRNIDVHDLLTNHAAYSLPISKEPPHRPPGGSLFLFDRAAVRFFRKDGFAWRKKPDGRTVRETHEKLKVNDKEALHCYYAHTDPTDSIQRRCYWLTEATEDIVLVHYLQLVNPRHANRAIRPRPAVQDSSVASGTPPSYTSSPRSLHGSEEQAPFGSGGYVDEPQPAYAMPAPLHPSHSQPNMLPAHDTLAPPGHYVDHHGAAAAAPSWGHMPPPPPPSFRRPVSAFSAAAHNGVPVSQPLHGPQRAMTAPGNLSADLSMDLSWEMPKLPSLLMDADMLSTSPDKLPGALHPFPSAGPSLGISEDDAHRVRRFRLSHTSSFAQTDATPIHAHPLRSMCEVACQTDLTGPVGPSLPPGVPTASAPASPLTSTPPSPRAGALSPSGSLSTFDARLQRLQLAPSAQAVPAGEPGTPSSVPTSGVVPHMPHELSLAVFSSDWDPALLQQDIGEAMDQQQGWGPDHGQKTPAATAQ